MKRVFAVLLLALFLCGWAEQVPEEATGPTAATRPSVAPRILPMPMRWQSWVENR